MSIHFYNILSFNDIAAQIQSNIHRGKWVYKKLFLVSNTKHKQVAVSADVRLTQTGRTEDKGAKWRVKMLSDVMTLL